MAAANSLALNQDRRVAVQFDSGVSPDERRRPPALCFVGVVPPDAPFVADLFPSAVIRDTRFRDPDFSVEHIRVTGRAVLEALPGLRGGAPSRLRDSVGLALHAGADEVDVVLARVGGAKPWELDRADLLEALDPFLGDMLGTMIVYPDLGGPVVTDRRGAVVGEERVERFIHAVKLHEGRWTQRYQVALLDAPGVSGSLETRLFRGLLGTDSALCRFEPNPHWDGIHGWRSAASLMGGIVVGTVEFASGYVDRQVELDRGRQIKAGRYDQLALVGDSFPPPARSDEYVSLQIRRNVATVRSEPTFRQPLGQWSVTSLRTVKAIHWRLVDMASHFVFDKAHEAQAAALADGLLRVLKPFANYGILVGPDGRGLPEVRGGVDRNPSAPALFADITAMLQPWSEKVVVRVGMRPGNPPSLEVR
jgi:hypothetical protein